jgi:hypothetical protein
MRKRRALSTQAFDYDRLCLQIEIFQNTQYIIDNLIDVLGNPFTWFYNENPEIFSHRLQKEFLLTDKPINLA